MKTGYLCVVGVSLLATTPFLVAAKEGYVQKQAEIVLHETKSNKPEEVETREMNGRAFQWITGVNRSTLAISLPEPGVVPSAAIVICPGGAYMGLAYDMEGTYIAKWMNDRGVAAGILKYRTGGGPNRHPAPLDDAQLALQIMRARADQYGYPSDKIGVMGFSAGGHLAATAATQFLEPNASADDYSPAAQSSRPDFLVLAYPVVSMEDHVTHNGSRGKLLGKSPSEELKAELSADERVTSRTPPTFLLHATDDPAVGVENSLRFYRACVQNDVPAELHVFEKGGHGFGMWHDELPVRLWPELLEAWMRQHQLMAGE